MEEPSTRVWMAGVDVMGYRMLEEITHLIICVSNHVGFCMYVCIPPPAPSAFSCYSSVLGLGILKLSARYCNNVLLS